MPFWINNAFRLTSRVLVLILGALLISVVACAETIVLKNGKTVVGKIIEKTDKHIKIDFYGVTLTYFLEDVDHIENAKGAETSTESSQLNVISDSELYINEEYGFEIKKPIGWRRVTDKAALGKAKVLYRRNPQDEGKDSFPVLSVVVDPREFKTSVECAEFYLNRFLSQTKKDVIKKVIQSPCVTQGSGIEGAYFIIEFASPSGKVSRMLDCKFIKRDLMVSIQGIDWAATFDESLKSFKESINSFKFRDLTTKIILIDKGEKFYINKDPYFSLRIPDNTYRKWHFLSSSDINGSGFWIVTENFSPEEKKRLPFVSCTVEPLPPGQLLKSKDELFQEIDVEHERWERKVARQAVGHDNDIKIIRKGSLFNISGFKIFERVVESIGNTYHGIYVYFDKHLLQLGLNTMTSDFAQDDADFMNILNTLSTKPE